MMKFEGVYTALVTPFRNGEVDYEALKKLVELQVAGRVSGIVPVGTTGESPTLSPQEHLKVIETVIETAAGRCQVIAGTGANSTEEAVFLTSEAKAVGADATLQVTPYYNKPTQEGFFRSSWRSKRPPAAWTGFRRFSTCAISPCSPATIR